MKELQEIPNHPDYRVDALGNIFSFKKSSVKKLKTHLRPNGYLKVCLADAFGVFKTRDVHVVVCEAFNGPRPPTLTCSHINGVKLDNSAKNLCWESQNDNLSRKINHGTHDHGCKNSRAKLNLSQVQEIRVMLSRGDSRRVIGEKFGVGRRLVDKIARGEHYKNDF